MCSMCERERERDVFMLSLIKWVSHFLKYLQKCKEKDEVCM